jgi:carboxypeptidase Q
MKFPAFQRPARLTLLLLVTLGSTAAVHAQPPDLDALTRIRQEGFRNSKVMENIAELCDRIGPRLTGSPNGQKASEWTRTRFEELGLTNAHLESWGPFGDGWSQEFASVRMLAPDVAQLYAIPRPWTPGTDGAVRAKVVHVVLKTAEDLTKNKGRLAGKIVLLGDPADTPVRSPEAPNYSSKDLDELAEYRVPSGAPVTSTRVRPEFVAQLRAFIAEEKPLAIILPNRGSDGTIFVQASGGTYESGKHDVVATLSMALEHFNRIDRLLKRKVDVELEVNVATTFYPDAKPQNTVAELAGTDARLKGQVVMLGAHLDSWAGGTGATDNAVGCAVVIEAMRILKATGLKPRRTIRAALWTGEEQGLFGSKAYVSDHFASRPAPKGGKKGPTASNAATGPLTVKPEHAKLAAYFNLDNGAGRIRGIYAQENAAAAAVFEAWITPLKDLGVTTITQRNTSSTDHIPFDAVGLPGYQFIQDVLDYNTRTHHSNMDVPEHLKREDLAQASVVMAWFVYNAAMRDEMMPRKPMPKDPPPAPTKAGTVAQATD